MLVFKNEDARALAQTLKAERVVFAFGPNTFQVAAQRLDAYEILTTNEPLDKREKTARMRAVGGLVVPTAQMLTKITIELAPIPSLETKAEPEWEIRATFYGHYNPNIPLRQSSVKVEAVSEFESEELIAALELEELIARKVMRAVSIGKQPDETYGCRRAVYDTLMPMSALYEVACFMSNPSRIVFLSEKLNASASVVLNQLIPLLEAAAPTHALGLAKSMLDEAAILFVRQHATAVCTVSRVAVARVEHGVSEARHKIANIEFDAHDDMPPIEKGWLEITQGEGKIAVNDNEYNIHLDLLTSPLAIPPMYLRPNAVNYLNYIRSCGRGKVGVFDVYGELFLMHPKYGILVGL